MPIYEYQELKPGEGCLRCRIPFEVIQDLKEAPLVRCPACGIRVKKIISRCAGVVVETPEETKRAVRQIRDYEQSGMWSHAAELADTLAEKAKDADLKTRAVENYHKAGHNVDGLSGN